MPEGAAPVRSPGQTTIRHHLVATFGRISVSGSLGGRQGFVRRARAGYCEGGGGEGRGVRFRLKLSRTRSLALALFCVRVTVGEAAESEARVTVDLTSQGYLREGGVS